MSFCWIVLFKPHLNSSIKDLFLDPLSLTILLNFYTYSFIFLFPYSTCFNFATFLDLLSPSPNSFFISSNNSLTISKSHTLVSKSSNMFSFQMSTASSCIYYKTHYTCSSTASLLIFILINNLHIVINPDIFSDFPSNTCGIATSALDPVLGLETLAIFFIFLFTSINV